jgi:hypothetical protein
VDSEKGAVVDVDYYRLPFQLTIALVQPVLVVGLTLGGAYLNAYGSPILGFVLSFAGMVAWVFSIALHAPMGIIFLSSIALMIAWGATWVGVETGVLHDRGVRTTCTVLDVSKRTETHTTYNGDGDWSTTTHTYYDHDLRCTDDHINSMTLSSRAADDGQQLDVIYDPADRVGAQPADHVSDGFGAARVSGVALAVSVFLRVIGVLWRARRPAW